jgi:hypothetical protein
VTTDSGTYTTVGTTLNFNSAVSTPYPSPYCVQGIDP